MILLFPILLRAQSPLPDEFNPGVTEAGLFPDPSVYSMAVQADGKILLGGSFLKVGGQLREFIGRVRADGAPDTTFAPGADGPVFALALQTDGKILVGGMFSTLGGQPRASIARLNPDGALDTAFNPGAEGSVYALAVQQDGKILVGGDFITLGGQARSRIGRLNTNGTLDLTFNPVIAGNDFPSASCLTVQSDGKIVVGGSFSTLGGQPRANLGRLNANGTLDTTFNPAVGGGDFPNVIATALQPDGKILVGGGFTSLGGQLRDNIGRLNTNGTVDAGFNPGAGGLVVTLAVQTDGKILAGGYFSSLGGQPRAYLGRIHADGTLDTGFDSGADNGVDSVALQADGKVLVGGMFSSLGGQPRSSLGRLNNTEPATQLLSYVGSTITWQRGGSSPEVWRTTFEQSATGLTWTNLGTGTRIAGGWQLTGVSLPAGRTLRARGQVAGGVQAASWFVESHHGAPAISSQPLSQTNNFGATAQFEVTSVGSGPLSYQWLRNGVGLLNEGNASGADDSILTLGQVSYADNADYRVVVGNGFGSVTSLVATLTVVDPRVTQHPVSAIRSPGGSVTFTVTAVGTPPLNYQWYREAAALPGATDPALTISNLSSADAGRYAVEVSNAGGSTTSLPAVLTVNGATVDTTFNPRANAAVFSLAIQPDGKILVGGAFTNLGGVARNQVARLNVDGTVDPAFDPGVGEGGLFGARVNALAVQADGKILVAGDFTTLSGKTRNRIGRLNPDGTLETAFNPDIHSFFDLFTEVQALALQPDGKIVLGGIFDTLGGGERINIGRINANGTLDGFNPGLSFYDNSQPVNCLAVQPDGKILVGGAFTELGRQARTNLGRVTSAGLLDTTFNPNPDGPVDSVAVQADGKILVGGGFTVLGAQARTNLGRLNTNGTLDATFNPNPNGQVLSLVQQADGKILVGGAFTLIGGQSRNRIARLNPDGTPDPTFNPGANGSVRAVAIQSDGKILAGGNFGSLEGVGRSALGRLNNNTLATQSLALAGSIITWLRAGSAPEVGQTTFEYSANGTNWTSFGAGARIPGGWQRTGASLPPGNTLRARGQAVGGQQNASGWLVEGYHGKPVFISQPASRTNGGTATATFQALVGGSEPIAYQWLKNGVGLADQGNISGATSNFLTLTNVLVADEGAYRLVANNSFGSATSLVANLTVLNPLVLTNPASTVRNAGETAVFNVTAVGTLPLSYQWYRDGVLLPGAESSSLTLSNLSRMDAGRYTVTVGNADGSSASQPASLTVNVSTADSAFNPQAEGTVFALAAQANGGILVGGTFRNPVPQSDLLSRLNDDGSLDDYFNQVDEMTFPRVNSVAVQTDGKILAGGWFAALNGQPLGYVGRLNGDLTPDQSFNPSVRLDDGTDPPDPPEIFSLATQADGKILLGGAFTRLGGQVRNYIGRLNSNGTVEAFNPGANAEVITLAVQADGKILVGGRFSILGGQLRSGIGRLSTNGTLDATFNPGVDATVWAIAVQADGRILVGGYFTTLGGQSRNYIGRLNTDGTLDATFNPGANGRVSTIAIQTDGRVLLGGDFTTLGGQTRNHIGRLHADGTVDLTFHPKVEGSSLILPTVYSLGVQEDGKILVGGNFTSLGGQSRRYFARLNNTDPSNEDLTYSNSTITWLRGGTGTEVWRTTFERSTDGLTWTSLGNGTRIPGGWQLTGVSLPANGFARARGHTTGGNQNASSWFVESVLDLTPAIRLSLIRDGSSIVLNWTGGQGPYQVQQSTDVNQPDSWQEVGAPTQTNSLSLPIGPGTVFLRVRGQ